MPPPYLRQIRCTGGRIRILLAAFLIWAVPSVFLSAETFVLQLRWDFQYQFAGYIAAEWMGYYDDEGLDVEIRSAFDSRGEILSPITEVTERRADFGIGAADILIAQDQGKPLEILASIFQHSAVEFYAPTSAGMHNPGDLARLRVSRRINDMVDVELQAMLMAEGIDPNLIKAYPFDQSEGYFQGIFNGTLDVVPGYRIGTPYEAAIVGLEIDRLRPSDYGVDFYGDSLFTRRDLLESMPDEVEAFTRASLKGWEYALNHPEAIAERIIREFQPKFVVTDFPSFVRFQIDPVKELTLYPVVEIGSMNPARWKRMHATLRHIGLVHGEFDPLIALYDPALRESLKQERFKKIFVGVSVVLATLAVFAVFWILSLRRLIAMKTGQLERRNQELNLAQRMAEIGNWHFDPEVGVPIWSDVVYTIYNRPKEQGPPSLEDYRNIYEDAHLKLFWDSIQSAINEGAPYDIELRLTLPGIRPKWIRAICDPSAHRGPKGHILHGTIQDITSRKEREEALLHQRLVESSMAKLAGSLLSSPSIEHTSAHVLDTAKTLTQSPLGFVGYLDSNTGRLVCSTMTEDIWDKCLLPDKSHTFDQFGGLSGWVIEHREAVMTNAPGDDPRSLGTPDGHIPIKSFLSTPVTLGDRVVGQIALANAMRPYTSDDLAIAERLADLFALTILRQEEAEHLEATRIEAEAASRAKSEFLANMSHEIRTPMNGVLGMLQLLGATPLDEEQKEYIRMAVQSSKRMTRLLSDILDLSRVEARKLSIQSVPFELGDIMRQLHDFYAPIMREKELRLSMNIPGDIPGPLIGDPVRLQQILMNLMDNAIKFTQNGTVSLDISVPDESDGTMVEILFMVADTGIGVPEDKIDTLFEPFVQGSDGVDRQYQGAGLGLAICARLTNLMNGSLTVANQEEHGSVFTLRLPFHIDSEHVPASDQKPELKSNAKISKTGGMKILLAEDDRINQLLMSKLLENSGCEIKTANNGQEVIDLLAIRNFDAVIMDIQMPVLDGLEATKAIREGTAGQRNVEIPIIAMTAYAMAGDKDRFLKAGMSDYLSKPIEAEDLRRVLARLKRLL